jgi:hypothetical protein
LALHFLKKVKNRITLIYIKLIQSKQETLQKKVEDLREKKIVVNWTGEKTFYSCPAKQKTGKFSV